jgi:hypothetical protein
MASRRSASAMLLLACAFGGCEATMMTGGHVAVPILLGPVRCIGCEASAPPPGAASFEHTAHYQYMIGGGAYGSAWQKEKTRPMLGRKAFAAVGRSCKGELRITHLKASAFDVYALVFALYRVEIDLEAIATVMPREACAPPPGPKDGPAADEEAE